MVRRIYNMARILKKVVWDRVARWLLIVPGQVSMALQKSYRGKK